MDILQLVYVAIILKYGNAARFFWISDQLFCVALAVGTETAERFSRGAFNQIKKMTENILYVRCKTYQYCLFWCVGLVPGTDEQIAQCRSPEQTIHECTIFKRMLLNEKESCNGKCNNDKEEDIEPNMKPCLDLLKRVAEQLVSNDIGSSSSPSDSQFSSGSPSSYNVPSPDCQPSLPTKRKLEPDSDSDLPSPKRHKIDATSPTFYSRPDQRSHYKYSSPYSMSRSPTERESPMLTPTNVYFGSTYVPPYAPLSSNTNQRPNDGLLPDNMVPQDCNTSLLSPLQTGSDHSTWHAEFGSPASDSQSPMSLNDSQISSSYSTPSYTSNNNSFESYSPDDPVLLPCNPTDLPLSLIPSEDVPLEELMVDIQDGDFVYDAFFELDADGLDQIRSALDRGGDT